MDVIVAAPSPRATDAAQGSTVVVENVIAKIAGIAARRVSGVHRLGDPFGGGFASIRTFLDHANDARGVSIEVDGTDVSVVVVIVAHFPLPLQPLAAEVREAVATALESFVSLRVVDVTVRIADIHVIPEPETSALPPSRQ